MKLLSNRQLRRRINNAVQNILLPSCIEANNDFNPMSTNTQNLYLPMCYTVGNNESVINVDTVNTINEFSPTLITHRIKL